MYRREREKIRFGEKPKILIHVFLSSHCTAIDIKKLAEPFSRADLFIPELAQQFWASPLGIDTYQKVSDGELTPSEAMQQLNAPLDENSFFYGICQLMYDTRKPIRKIDADFFEEASWNYREFNFDRYLNGYNKIMDSLLDPNVHNFNSIFRKAIQMLRNWDFNAYFSEATKHIDRDQLMLEKAPNVISKFLKDNPQYKERDSFNVLLQLGAYHTRVYHGLRKMFPGATYQFSVSPNYIYDISTEALRRVSFGKVISDELLARVLLQRLLNENIGGQLNKLTLDSEKKSLFMRRLIERFTYDQVKEFYQTVRQNLRKGKDIQTAVVDQLYAREFILPQSEADLVILIGKLGKKS